MSAESAKHMPPGSGGPGGQLGGPGGEGRMLAKMQNMMEQTYDYKGTQFPVNLVPRENLEAMETFEVRDDDIFIITYPKCGTHWSLEIVYLILADGYPNKIDRDEKMKFGLLEMTIATPNNKLPAYKYVDTIKSLRVLPTHLPVNVIPQAVFQNKGKVVYVTRNPKDCLTSMNRFISKVLGINKWVETFEQFLSKDAINGNFIDFNLAYWKHRHDENFLFVKYEDMKRDTRSSVIAIADHIGCVLSEDAIDRVVKNCSMDQMKKSYQKADEEGVFSAFSTHDKESLGKFLQKGEVGDWKNHFTVAQNERFDEFYREKMAGSVLKFEFE